MKQTKPRMIHFTFNDFNKMFPDDDACLEWLLNYLYPEGIFCKPCKRTTKHHRIASRRSYSCDHCGHHVHPTADTIFHKSSTPLTTWFHAIYLMASTRCGISAKQIERETGVTYKTAWRMFNKIRTLLDEDDSEPLGGSVEMDETYFGGRRKGARGRPLRGDKKKTPIVGIVQRKGRVVARTTQDAKGSTLLPLIAKHVLPDTTVYTDEWTGYDGVPHMKDADGKSAGYKHRRIRHSAKIYVMGDIHTNSVEGFWSLIKRGIGGVYHAVSQKYLQNYLDEYSFRYNRRFDIQPMFMTFLRQIAKS